MRYYQNFQYPRKPPESSQLHNNFDQIVRASIRSRYYLLLFSNSIDWQNQGSVS